MEKAQWQLQTAKAQLSELIEAALQGQPQRITRRGKDAVMVVSESAYLSLKNNGKKQALNFIDHLLAIPKEQIDHSLDELSSSRIGKVDKRPKLKLRELDL